MCHQFMMVILEMLIVFPSTLSFVVAPRTRAKWKYKRTSSWDSWVMLKKKTKKTMGHVNVPFILQGITKIKSYSHTHKKDSWVTCTVKFKLASFLWGPSQCIAYSKYSPHSCDYRVTTALLEWGYTCPLPCSFRMIFLPEDAEFWWVPKFAWSIIGCTQPRQSSLHKQKIKCYFGKFKRQIIVFPGFCFLSVCLSLSLPLPFSLFPNVLLCCLPFSC